MKWRTVQEIQERRAEILDENDAIIAMAKAENRDATAEEKATFDGNMSEIEALEKEEIEAAKFEAAKAQAAARRVQSALAMGGGGGRADVPRVTGGGGNRDENDKPKLPAQAISHLTLRAFKGQNAELEAYQSGMWLSAVLDDNRQAQQYCREHGVGIRADAQTADDFAKGGIFVPAPLSAAIIRVVSDVGIARRLCDVVPMQSETLDVSRRSAGLTVYAPGEQTAITSSEVSWNRVSLTVRDRATLTRISRKLLRASVVGIAERVAEEIGYAFALQQDKEFILGDGTSTYFGEVGLNNAIGAAGINTMTTTSGDTWAETTLNDFTNTMALLPSQWWGNNPAWLCSAPYYHSVMLRLMNAGGGNTNQTLAGGVGMGQFLGYPVYFSDRMPTATAVSTIQAYFGNFPASTMLGDRVGVEIMTSTERYFDSDEIAIRGKIAYDINVYEAGDASTAGAVVALKTGAAS